MSFDASKMATPVDLLYGNGTATGTQAGQPTGLPPGIKAVQISVVTSATLTAKIQNSIDKVNWFDVVIATNTSLLAEVTSQVPFWRANITSHTTSGTGTSVPIVVLITQGPTQGPV